MSVKDTYLLLLINENKTNDTSFAVRDYQTNVIGNVENNQQIDSTNAVLKTLGDVHNDLITSVPITPQYRTIFERG